MEIRVSNAGSVKSNSLVSFDYGSTAIISGPVSTVAHRWSDLSSPQRTLLVNAGHTQPADLSEWITPSTTFLFGTFVGSTPSHGVNPSWLPLWEGDLVVTFVR